MTGHESKKTAAAELSTAELIAMLRARGMSSDEILNGAFGVEAQKVDGDDEAEKKCDLENEVTDILREIGIPPHIKGHGYVRFAIILGVENPEALNSVTKVLYPTVAENFKTTSSRVERAIRHAVEVGWDRGDVDVLSSYFGYTIQNSRGKPTNSEFIAMMVDKLRLKHKGR